LQLQVSFAEEVGVSRLRQLARPITNDFRNFA